MRDCRACAPNAPVESYVYGTTESEGPGCMLPPTGEQHAESQTQNLDNQLPIGTSVPSATLDAPEMAPILNRSGCRIEAASGMAAVCGGVKFCDLGHAATSDFRSRRSVDGSITAPICPCCFSRCPLALIHEHLLLNHNLRHLILAIIFLNVACSVARTRKHSPLLKINES
jgi:hypothetical protein